MRQSLNLTKEERRLRVNELSRARYKKRQENRKLAGYYKILEIAFNEFSTKIVDAAKNAEADTDEQVTIQFTPTIIELAEKLAQDDRFHLVYKEDDLLK